jgi:hypothetical protein
LKEVKRRRLTLRTVSGKVAIEAACGRDRETGQWVIPIRELWGLGPHETMSPVLEERVCRTATRTFSYEAAADVAATWGSPVDDSGIHGHVQKRGARAIELEEERTERALDVETRGDVVAEAARDLGPGEFSLVIMMDGTMLRERGPEWGLKPAEIKANRVEWHDCKVGIIYRLQARAETQSGRGVILEKFFVTYRGEPFEFGRRLYAEAVRRGLYQAKKVYVVADGGVWIWKIKADRFPDATGGLDFYHASEHLWVVANDYFGQGSEKARAWVEPLLHQLKHGGEAGVLQSLHDLLKLCQETLSAATDTLRREVNYFDSHKDDIHYEKLASEGCPIGSGAVESACSQMQDRFKRTGQFWTLPGEQRLMALEVARRNNDWDEIWELIDGQC